MKITQKDLFLAIPELLHPVVLLYILLVAYLIITEGVIPELWEKIMGGRS